jgi:4-hydroxy 2-oxovalerate aldolase
MAGVFSGFAKHVSRISNEYKVDARDVYVELGRRRIVGGQEDIIIEVVMDLIRKGK